MLNEILSGKPLWDLLRSLESGMITASEMKYAAQNRYRLQKRLERLSKEGLIDLGGELVKLTERGKRLLKTNQLEEIQIEKTPWDGIWHVVCYDIPNTLAKERNTLRRQFKGWGFYMLQKSMWVYPYKCKEEVALVAKEHGVAQYIYYLNTDDLPIAEKLKRYFKL